MEGAKTLWGKAKDGASQAYAKAKPALQAGWEKTKQKTSELKTKIQGSDTYQHAAPVAKSCCEKIKAGCQTAYAKVKNIFSDEEDSTATTTECPNGCDWGWMEWLLVVVGLLIFLAGLYTCC